MHPHSFSCASDAYYASALATAHFTYLKVLGSGWFDLNIILDGNQMSAIEEWFARLAASHLLIFNVRFGDQQVTLVLPLV